jgi:membrane protein YqaA with SNARE-associated domain
MVDWKIGRFHIKNLEIFTFIVLTTLYTLAATITEGSKIYIWIANLSQMWIDIAVNSSSALTMAFIFSTFGNTSILIVFPYAFIVYLIAQHYPNFWLLGLVSGIGAGIGEITSYIVGRIIGASKTISESEMGEKLHKIKKRFEKKPGAIPWTVFIFAVTPIPDDMILVPFGIMKYPYYKTVIPCMIGKTILTTLMAFLGYLVGQNAEMIDLIIEYYPWASPLRLIIPSAVINPAADLIQFSMVFIIIYLMGRIDFEKISKKRSWERKLFERILNEGGIFTTEELDKQFEIINKEKFHIFMETFIQNHQNVEKKDDTYQFNALLNRKKAYEQSLEFIDYLFT